MNNCRHGYLHNPNLSDDLYKKLPRFLLSIYVRYNATANEDKSDLEKSAKFVFEEANMRITVNSSDSQNKRYRSDNRNMAKNVLFTETNDKDVDDQPPNKKRRHESHYFYCKRKNHGLIKCREFPKIKLNERWKLVRTQRLCYLCLEEGHFRENFRKKLVSQLCNRNHDTVNIAQNNDL